jgi:hypothetical protein
MTEDAREAEMRCARIAILVADECQIAMRENRAYNKTKMKEAATRADILLRVLALKDRLERLAGYR